MEGKIRRIGEEGGSEERVRERSDEYEYMWEEREEGKFRWKGRSSIGKRREKIVLDVQEGRKGRTWMGGGKGISKKSIELYTPLLICRGEG